MTNDDKTNNELDRDLGKFEATIESVTDKIDGLKAETDRRFDELRDLVIR